MKYMFFSMAAMSLACAAWLAATQERKPIVDILSTPVPQSTTPAEANREISALRAKLAVAEALPAKLDAYRLKCKIVWVVFALNSIVLFLVLIERQSKSNQPQKPTPDDVSVAP